MYDLASIAFVAKNYYFSGRNIILSSSFLQLYTISEISALALCLTLNTF